MEGKEGGRKGEREEGRGRWKEDSGGRKQKWYSYEQERIDIPRLSLSLPPLFSKKFTAMITPTVAATATASAGYP